MADGWQAISGPLRFTQAALDVQLVETPGLRITVGSVLAALLVMLAIVVASGLLRRALARYARAYAEVNSATVYTLARITHYTLISVGAVFALGTAGVSINQFVLVAGALGVGLGFGLQQTFNNFISGLVLLFGRSMKVGDYVEVGSGVHGQVRDIHLRATRVTTNDNIDILVPNSEFVNGRVINWTLRETSRRIKVPFRVAYGADKDLVRAAGLEAAAAVPFTLDDDGPRRAQVWLTGFDDSAMNFALVVWLNEQAVGRQGAIIAAYSWELHSSMQRHGIAMPFAQRDIHLRSVFDQQGEEGVRLLTKALAGSQTAARPGGPPPGER